MQQLCCRGPHRTSRVDRGSWQTRRGPMLPSRGVARTGVLHEALEMGWEVSIYLSPLHEKRGSHHLRHRTRIPIHDAEGRLVAYLAGSPSGNEWRLQVHDEFLAAAHRAQDSCTFSHDKSNHRPGAYNTLTAGISHGNGQVRPGNLQSSKQHEAAMTELLAQPCVHCIAGFMNSWSFALFFLAGA